MFLVAPVDFEHSSNWEFINICLGRKPLTLQQVYISFASTRPRLRLRHSWFDSYVLGTAVHFLSYQTGRSLGERPILNNGYSTCWFGPFYGTCPPKQEAAADHRCCNPRVTHCNRSLFLIRLHCCPG